MLSSPVCKFGCYCLDRAFMLDDYGSRVRPFDSTGVCVCTIRVRFHCYKGPFKFYVTPWGCRLSWKKALRRCNVQRYKRYEWVGWGSYSQEKSVT